MANDESYPHGDPEWPHSFSIDYAQRYATFFAAFPDLQEALSDETGNLMFTRVMCAPFALLESSFLYEVYERASLIGQFMTVRHPPEFSADGNIKAIEQAKDAIAKQFGEDAVARVLKTVTIAFPLPEDEGRLIVLYSGIGDFHVSKQAKRDIAEALGLTNYSAKRAVINPPMEVFDPMVDLGIIPGQIKPVIPKERLWAIHGICYEHQDSTDRATHVAVTDSPFDSLIVPVEVFETTFHWYAEAYYRDQTKHLALPGMDMYRINQVQ